METTLREYSRREHMLFDSLDHWNRAAREAHDGWARCRAERNAAQVAKKLHALTVKLDEAHAN